MIPNRAANDVVSLLVVIGEILVAIGERRGDRRGISGVDEREDEGERIREGKERFVGENVTRRGCS